MRGELKLDTRAFGPSATIIDIVRETLLTRVEVDCGYALTRLKEGDSNVQRRRGFASNRSADRQQAAAVGAPRAPFRHNGSRQ